MARRTKKAKKESCVRKIKSTGKSKSSAHKICNKSMGGKR